MRKIYANILTPFESSKLAASNIILFNTRATDFYYNFIGGWGFGFGVRLGFCVFEKKLYGGPS